MKQSSGFGLHMGGWILTPHATPTGVIWLPTSGIAGTVVAAANLFVGGLAANAYQWLIPTAFDGKWFALPPNGTLRSF